MKKLIQDNGGFQLYAEFRAIEALNNQQYELKFTTVYDNAKDPNAEQVNAQFIMTEDGINNLFDIINRA
jgi:hypothetical protein